MRPLPDIRNVDVSGQRVIIRADLNVPMAGGRVTDRTRIARFAPTVRALTDRGASVVILTHLGRPEGEKNPVYSTQPLAGVLSEELGQEVRFVPDCVGQLAEWNTGHLAEGEVVLLENLRFYPGEIANDRNFALRLSVHGDLYVNDAFSCAHRAHASTQAIAGLMPAYAGPSLMAEVEALKGALESPERPVAALVGGSKVSTKIDVLTNLTSKVDTLIIGGGMANTFLAALGHPMGSSLYEPDAAKVARDIMARAAARGCEIILPSDVVVAAAFAAHADNCVVPADAIPNDRMALDVGPETTARIIAAISRARTLLWNGPLGAFELEPFGAATFAVARAAAERSMAGRLVSIAGGGDTVAALNGAGVTEGFSYVSTAGGAFLEWIEGKALPGIEILTRNSTSTRVA
ncbi:phosphoglycerate kinase [Rhizobium aquaticum]|uniref:Phosphoglycerate kinase n=1 Tax=Rhizobium aquaticum TaxID=1549636 RepID=A0ABV2J013_9HYPH